jgi:FkbM family methyltransferase
VETTTEIKKSASSRYRGVAREFSLLAGVKVERSKKAAYAGTLVISAFEYAIKKIRGKNPRLDRIINKRMEGRIFTAQYGKFKLVLTIDDIRQGLHDIERESYAAFKKYVKPGKTVCDAGAHIGTHTLKMADAVGDNGRVIAVEPDVNNFGLLCLNIKLNDLAGRVVPIRAALSTKRGTAKLFNPTTDDKSMYFSLTRESDNYDVVDTIDFAGIFEDGETDTIDFMKIDIEGAEEQLLLSQTEAFMRKAIKAIYVDGHSEVDYGAIAAHMKKFGYKHEEQEKGHLFVTE